MLSPVVFLLWFGVCLLSVVVVLFWLVVVADDDVAVVIVMVVVVSNVDGDCRSGSDDCWYN